MIIQLIKTVFNASILVKLVQTIYLVILVMKLII